MYLVYIIMSELVAAMKRKSEAITAARAEADVIGGTDTDKADKHFKKLCTAINRDFNKVKRAHEAAEEQNDPKEKTQKQEERAALKWPDADAWQDWATSEKDMKDTRKELNEWCGGTDQMITPPAGLHGANLHNSKHADKMGALYWLQSQNLQGEGPVMIKIPMEQVEESDILPGGWEKVRHIRCAFAAHSLHSLRMHTAFAASSFPTPPSASSLCILCTSAFIRIASVSHCVACASGCIRCIRCAFCYMMLHSTLIRRSASRGLRPPLPTAPRAPPGSTTLQSTWLMQVSHDPMLLPLCDSALLLTRLMPPTRFDADRDPRHAAQC